MDNFIKQTNLLFFNYVKNYDINDWNISRKIVHSFTVADTCFMIASHLKLNIEQRKMAYFIGLFHDIGRFEQWNKYHTYNDKQSIDHGDLSYQILKNESNFNFANFDSEDFNIILLAIKFHTKEYKGNNENIKLFSEIIMGADSYSNIKLAASGGHVFFNNIDGYTNEIVKNFINLKPLYNFNITKKLDRVLAILANSYYVRFQFLKQNIIEYNLIDEIYEMYKPQLCEQDQKNFDLILAKFKENYIK